MIPELSHKVDVFEIRPHVTNNRFVIFIGEEDRRFDNVVVSVKAYQ
jgi:hypothetical protein